MEKGKEPLVITVMEDEDGNYELTMSIGSEFNRKFVNSEVNLDALEDNFANIINDMKRKAAMEDKEHSNVMLSARIPLYELHTDSDVSQTVS
jgi:hypothetical protein